MSEGVAEKKLDANNLPEFDKSLFKVVQREEEIKDFTLKTKPVSYGRDVWGRFVKSKVSVVAAVFIIIIVFFAVFGPSMTDVSHLTQTHDHADLPPRVPGIEKLGILDGTRVLEVPTANLEKYADVYLTTLEEYEISAAKQIVPMSRIEIDAYKLAGAEDKYYYFGTDNLGRDMFTRLWRGTRISLILAVFVVLINLSIGLAVGSIAGYYGGWVDFLIVRFMEILNAIPTLPLSILLILLFGAGLQTMMLVFVMTGWISMAYSVRIQFYRFKSMEYVLASRTMGARDPRIMYKYILPNAAGTLITICALTVPSVIFQEAALSYLGLGIQAPEPSIGTLLSEGQKQLFLYPYLTVFPGLVIVLLMLSFNLLGNGLRDAFNPALRE